MSDAGERIAYILLAEDEPTNQYVFKAILESGNYEVNIVSNGQLALDEVVKRKPDIILLDMMMPVMDGYKAAQQLIRDTELDGVPILALTAQAMKGDSERTLDAGCDDYMSKPIRRNQLLEKVEEWLGKRGEAEWMDKRAQKRLNQEDNAA
jgi:CheY-like chemotaxis protein